MQTKDFHELKIEIKIHARNFPLVMMMFFEIFLLRKIPKREWNPQPSDSRGDALSL